MTTTNKTIGRVPYYIEPWDNGTAYQKQQIVSLFGSAFISTIDDNSNTPATKDSNGVVTVNTSGGWHLMMQGTSYASVTGTSETQTMHQKAISEKLAEIGAEVWPLDVTLTGGGVYEIGTTPSVSLAWTVKRKGAAVTPSSQKINGTAATSPASYSPTTDTTYTLAVVYDGVSASKSVQAKFVNASYIGTVAATTTTLDATAIKALTKAVNASKSYTATQALSNQKACFAYPKSFGALTSIKDANNFEYLGSYTRTEVTVDSVAYYCYLLTNAVTISSFKQIYT